MRWLAPERTKNSEVVFSFFASPSLYLSFCVIAVLLFDEDMIYYAPVFNYIAPITPYFLLLYLKYINLNLLWSNNLPNVIYN